jgi:hypothetical protein
VIVHLQLGLARGNSMRFNFFFLSKANFLITYFCIFLAVIFPVSSIFSETILFKKGGSLKGKVIGQNQNKIVIEKEDGTRTEVLKNDILKVVYKNNLNSEDEQKIRKAETKKLPPLEENKIAEKEKIPLIVEEIVNTEPRISKENKEFTELEATWRSAVFPGWGQWNQERYLSGIFYNSMFLIGLYATYEKNRVYRNAKNDYDNLENPYSNESYFKIATGTPASVNFTTDPLLSYLNAETSPFKGQRRAVENHYRELQYIGGATALVYIWNILDAYIFHPDNQYKTESFVPALGNNLYLRSSTAPLDGIPFSEFGFYSSERKTLLGYEFIF